MIKSLVIRCLSLVCVCCVLCLGVSADEITDQIDAVIEVRDSLIALEGAAEGYELSIAETQAVIDQALASGASENDELLLGARALYNSLMVRYTDTLSTVANLRKELEPYSEYINMTYVGDFVLTNYCPNACCCGKWANGYAASGDLAVEGITCAADSRFPFGTKLYIEGVGYRIVQDRGYGIKDNRLDIFCSTHESCYEQPWGAYGSHRVYVVSD